MRQLSIFVATKIISTVLLPFVAHAGNLAIVIDDFGYHRHYENQILQMPVSISVAILPDAPYAKSMAINAHNQGREVLIHLPMAPLSKQPLEPNTLQPSMSSEEIQRIIKQAVISVPHASGLNNHMGSAMTSSLPGMRKVMQALNDYPLYFLDSVTIVNSQVTRAAIGTQVNVIKRKVFLDNKQDEAHIRQQINHAVKLARRNGSVIAIGHPYPTTIRVLQQMLPTLPADITLVRPSILVNTRKQQFVDKQHYYAEKNSTQHNRQHLYDTEPQIKAIKLYGTHENIAQYTVKQANEKIYAKEIVTMISERLRQNPAIIYLGNRWRQLIAHKKTSNE